MTPPRHFRVSFSFVCLTTLLAVGVLVSCSSHAANSPKNVVTVFAAASLTDVLKPLAIQFEQATGTEVRLSFASSATLARQIESGAPADIFFSADTQWVDYLQGKGLVRTSEPLLSNRLVLIAAHDNPIALKIAMHFPLHTTLGKHRLATGDPDTVPVGRYARSALIKLGVWNQVAERLVRTDDTRTALAYVARGEALLGIVYATDARMNARVRVVDVFDADLHAPIVYPLALTHKAGVNGANADAQLFADYLASAPAIEAFKRFGFMPMKLRPGN